ncbi:uncharacterized protein LOC125673287 [Ostrea edulis]|uniref:uncharacterized protein LOC125673287 n=1 Tax=Ostrea edulis TaxID=37623 RepID=UPI002095097B|nr:uncharacterized protein LOC125673287 [Ostrea edulis]
MACRFLSVLLLFGMLTNCCAQSGDNVCTRKVSKQVFYTETRRVSSRQCTNNVCRTVYSLKKVLKFRIQYSIAKHCCPGFVREGDRCVPISTTVSPTTETPYTTPPVEVVDPVDPVEGAVQGGNEGGPLSEGGIIGVVLAVLFIVAAAIVALMFKIRKQKKQDKEAILQQEMYRGQSLHENEVNPDLTTGGTFHNDLYNLTNQPPKGDTFNPEMYDQLHLYGNEADKVDHDYERPVRSNTIGGIPGDYYNKGRLPTQSIKSEGHQTVLYQNKSDVSNKVKVFERLTSQPSQDNPVENKMLYSDVRY